MIELHNILHTLSKKGAKCFYVGGYVRDYLLGLTPKDIDIEVHGISPEELVDVLSFFGKVDVVGKSFGVLRVSGLDVDFSQPRTEIKNGTGHKDFKVEINPFLPLEDAARRRDFTINSMMMEALSGKIIDPFSGQEDLKNKILRCVDPLTFGEDPLRVLRGIQFAARFELKIHPDTTSIMQKLVPELKFLPKERIFAEVEKLLLKAQKPSLGFELMRELGIVDFLFPELKALINCPQPPKHHPEGDVWAHTMLVVDEAAKLRDKSKDPAILMWAALTHDLGKPKVTKVGDRITSHGHDREGEKIAYDFLTRFSGDKHFLRGVTTLVREHMHPFALWKNQASDAALRRLARRVDIEELMLLAEADRKGRGKVEDTDSNLIQKWFRDKIETLGLNKAITPLVQGKDLIELGLSPGPNFKVILDEALEMQLEGATRKEILTYIENKCQDEIPH
ncbi:MAG: CCA tRNA nucleotidyltransferase [Peptococcales bacterium]|jgi:tRNA nucleotidyltransferase (CCA-adding enzyme)